MLQEWRALLMTLEVTGEFEQPATMNANELAEAEMRIGISLPTSYKEFCQVFGSGILGNGVKIQCPFPGALDLPGSLEGLLDELQLFPSKDLEYDKNLEELLNHSLGFGDDDGANMAIWDLRSYSELDESYDIYWIPNDLLDDDTIYLIGRDFFEFVRDFCLGTKSAEIFPDSTDFLIEPPPQTFFRYRK